LISLEYISMYFFPMLNGLIRETMLLDFKE
jgi:hypothetical protein